VRDFISSWTHGPDWKTWVAHSVIASGLALIFGWQVAIGYYFLRECEQIFYNFVDKKHIKWFDGVMDVLTPATVVGLATVLLHWIF